MSSHIEKTLEQLRKEIQQVHALNEKLINEINDTRDEDYLYQLRRDLDNYQLLAHDLSIAIDVLKNR
ncbi:hypothetical protein, partial [Nitrincola nitratireducens]|uniref:hypothetical protein n=1 Tax=Nitrincola nitratireducens TaxID=1229521 RepID=UPI00056B332F